MSQHGSNHSRHTRLPETLRRPLADTALWPEDFQNGVRMASLGRFELPTYRLGGGRSIHLSYRDVFSRTYNHWRLYYEAREAGAIGL